MDDCCERCGSYRLKPYKGCGAMETHPAESDGWECLDCGHFQAEEKDYDHYKEDYL